MTDRSTGHSPKLLARAGLSRVVEPGDPAAQETFAGMTAVEAWDRLLSGGRDLDQWRTRLDGVDPERDLERAAVLGARFVIPGDDEWPNQVDVLANAGGRNSTPYGLWVRGAADLRQVLERSVTVVGARACSSYGEHVAGEMGAGLADQGLTVVSGGAYGIDAAAHRGALAASGVTVAFLACGVDIAYPKGNTALLARIAELGLLVSELPPGCSPTRSRFIARNRLIAATTLGTVVVEAAVRSGALGTAAWAELCGRPVLAVPGPVTSVMSAGTHQLIRERTATLVTDATGILEQISPPDAPIAEGPTRPPLDSGVKPRSRLHDQRTLSSPHPGGPQIEL